MLGIKKLGVLGLALVLSACVSSEPASRSQSAEGLTLASRGMGSIPDSGAVRVLAAQYDVTDVQVAVPRALRVSEANTFYPMADIVWRGDAIGDRHMQVASIFSEAAARATGPMKTGRAVTVQIELVRFHGVTEKTRYTVGGTHNMVFDLTVRDAASGAVIDGPRRVAADAKAAGGQAAIAEEQAGRTQRVVVTETLAEVLRRELSAQVTDPRMVARAMQAPSGPVLVTR